MNFLDNLTKLLKRENLSRAELAKRLNIAPSTINSWYNRGYENVSLKFLLKICDYFTVEFIETMSIIKLVGITYTLHFLWLGFILFTFHT